MPIILAEIDPRPFEVQLEQAQGQLARDQAQLANARLDLARYQTLLSQDSIARQTLDAQSSTVAQFEAALRVDQAAIDSARQSNDPVKMRAALDQIEKPLAQMKDHMGMCMKMMDMMQMHAHRQVSQRRHDGTPNLALGRRAAVISDVPAALDVGCRAE